MRPSSLSNATLLLALSLSACSSSTPTPAAPPAANGPSTAPLATPKPTPTEQASFATSSNGLGFDLYAKLAAKPGNVAFSPASIETALTMTWAGSRGDTAAQMKSVLHLSDDRDAALAAAEKTLAALAAPHDGYELLVADRLFGERSYAFDPGFLAIEDAGFGAALEPVDFLHASEAGRRSVNGFVSAKTKGHIGDLLPPGAVDGDTRLVLVNAMYMHAKWASPFSKAATSPQAFHADGSSHDVPMMHQQSRFGFEDDGDTQVLDMPYGGGDLAMTVLLPKDPKGLGRLEASLGAGALGSWVKGLEPATVDVSLPRFRAAESESIALKPVLSALGMPLAFDEVRADFGGMSQPGAERLHIDDAYHKAFVDVDEEGTTAAAATAVVMTRETAVAIEPRPVEFRADHPFVYVIRDTRTNLVLFVGRVVDPTA